MSLMLESWVPGADDPEIGRGLNHLPLAAVQVADCSPCQLVVGIGNFALPLEAIASRLPEAVEHAVRQPSLNALLGLGPEAWAAVRTALQALLARGSEAKASLEPRLLPLDAVQAEIPMAIGEYTDFYASRDHARRVGELFRPERPLLENYDWLPIGYHGRASTIVRSGTPVRRPSGQYKDEGAVCFAPTRRLDFELEVALVVGRSNRWGEPIPVHNAEAHLFGVCLLNDWSARDIQSWEYQPLGPFLGKSFCTSISPWITPLAALAGVRCAAGVHPQPVLGYLDQSGAKSGFDLDCAVHLTTQSSRGAAMQPMPLARASTRHLYWTPAQMVAHHTSNGCNLRPGDLLGTGTISGPEPGACGCLLELTRNGAEPLQLVSGERRTFLEDGDEIILSAWARPPHELPVRLGECRGTLAAAAGR